MMSESNMNVWEQIQYMCDLILHNICRKNAKDILTTHLKILSKILTPVFKRNRYVKKKRNTNFFKVTILYMINYYLYGHTKWDFQCIFLPWCNSP